MSMVGTDAKIDLSGGSYASRNAILKLMGYQDYAAYLASNLWDEIRYQVMRGSIGRCCMCGREAQQVHHNRYDRATLEGKSRKELHAICDACHRRIEFDGDRKREPQEVRAIFKPRYTPFWPQPTQAIKITNHPQHQKRGSKTKRAQRKWENLYRQLKCPSCGHNTPNGQTCKFCKAIQAQKLQDNYCWICAAIMPEDYKHRYCPSCLARRTGRNHRLIETPTKRRAGQVALVREPAAQHGALSHAQQKSRWIQRKLQSVERLRLSTDPISESHRNNPVAATKLDTLGLAIRP